MLATYITQHTTSTPNDALYQKLSELLADLHNTVINLDLIQIVQSTNKFIVILSDEFPEEEPEQEPWADYYKLSRVL